MGKFDRTIEDQDRLAYHDLLKNCLRWGLQVEF